MIDLCSTPKLRKVGVHFWLPTSCNEFSMLPPVWSVTHGSSIAVWRTSLLHDELHWLDVGLSERVTYKMGVMVYRCLHGQPPRYLADHLITYSDVASRLRLRLYVPQTDTSSSYRAVDSTHRPTAVGCFRSLVRRSGIRCLTNSEIRRVVLTVLSSFLDNPV